MKKHALTEAHDKKAAFCGTLSCSIFPLSGEDGYPRDTQKYLTCVILTSPRFFNYHTSDMTSKAPKQVWKPLSKMKLQTVIDRAAEMTAEKAGKKGKSKEDFMRAERATFERLLRTSINLVGLAGAPPSKKWKFQILNASSMKSKRTTNKTDAVSERVAPVNARTHTSLNYSRTHVASQVAMSVIEERRALESKQKELSDNDEEEQEGEKKEEGHEQEQEEGEQHEQEEEEGHEQEEEGEQEEEEEGEQEEEEEEEEEQEEEGEQQEGEQEEEEEQRVAQKAVPPQHKLVTEFTKVREGRKAWSWRTPQRI